MELKIPREFNTVTFKCGRFSGGSTANIDQRSDKSKRSQNIRETEANVALFVFGKMCCKT